MNFLNRFRRTAAAEKLIIISVSLSVLRWLISFVIVLSGLGSSFALDPYLSLSGDIHSFLLHPWTLITYMWCHTSIWHLAINMLCLYVFGNFFVNFFSYRQLVSLYVMAGVLAGLLYPLLFALLSSLGIYYMHLPMYGSSASLLALVVAIGSYAPYRRVPTFFAKSIPLWAISLIFVLPSILSIQSANVGELIVHSGGIVIGFFFGYFMRTKAWDCSKWLGTILDWVVDKYKEILFRFKKVKGSTAKQSKEEAKKEEIAIDTILDKVKRSGYSVLTEEERRQLFEANKK